MKVLSDASSEIGPKMKLVYDVSAKTKGIKAKVQKKLEGLLDRVETGGKKFDLLEMHKALALANVYHKHLEPYFPITLRNRRSSCEKMYNDLKSSLRSSVDKFVNSHFQDEGCLRLLLSSTSSASAPKSTDLGDLHERTISYLEKASTSPSLDRRIS